MIKASVHAVDAVNVVHLFYLLFYYVLEQLDQSQVYCLVQELLEETDKEKHLLKGNQVEELFQLHQQLVLSLMVLNILKILLLSRLMLLQKTLLMVVYWLMVLNIPKILSQFKLILLIKRKTEKQMKELLLQRRKQRART